MDDNPLARFFGRRDAAFSPPDRLEVDLEDPTAFDRQMYDQVRMLPLFMQAWLLILQPA